MIVRLADVCANVLVVISEVEEVFEDDVDGLGAATMDVVLEDVIDDELVCAADEELVSAIDEKLDVRVDVIGQVDMLQEHVEKVGRQRPID